MIRKNKKEEARETGKEQQTAGPATGAEPEAATETAAAPADPEATIHDLNDKYLRLYSEFDNYRRRTVKEKAEMGKFAATDMIMRLLPVLDDFERAIKAAEATDEACTAMKDGVVLIFNKFSGILQQQGLQPMRTAGEKFDTDFHEAIANLPAPTPEAKGVIMDEVEKGYLLHGKVIRHAKVVVGN